MIDGNLRVLGRALQREDGRGKVTRQAHFMVDVICPDMLRGKILRSPLAHARIVNLDSSRARNLPGVEAVITRIHNPRFVWVRFEACEGGP